MSEQGSGEDGRWVKVRRGDCVGSIAFENGLFPNTLWNHSNNVEIKEARGDGYVLEPGDELFIPDKRIKEEERSPEKRHRFKRKGVPEKLVLKFMVFDEARADVRYRLDLEGTLHEGNTDAEGKIEHFVPPNATKATLILDDDETYELELGHLDPVKTDGGLRYRLTNLGLLDPEDNDQRAVTHALATFQQKHELEVTGEMNDDTATKLVEIHGC